MIDARQPSPPAARGYLAQMTRARQAVGKGWPPPLAAIVWPAGLDRSLLSTLPLTVRIRNCLERAKLTRGNAKITVAALLRTPNFGRTSIGDFVREVERYLVDCTRPSRDAAHGRPLRPNASDAGTRAPTAERNPGTSEQSNATASVAATLMALYADSTHSRQWRHATTAFRSLLATAADILGTPTLADALRPELVRLAKKMGLDTALRSVPLHEAMLGTTGLPALVALRLRSTLDGLNEKQRTVAEARLVQSPPATLEEAGRLLGVTRERVRQIQAGLEPKIEEALGPELGIIAAAFQEHLDPLVPANELVQCVDGINPEAMATATALFRNALIDAMGFTLDGDVYVNEQAAKVIRDVKSRASQIADDAGLLQEKDLIERLPDEKWRRFWPWIRRRSGLRSFHGSLALRDSAKARTKAALLLIGRPATKEEISALCGYEPKQVGSYLSNVPSVVRADRERLGFRDWIDDEYDGIVGEIIQRIEEDGGVTTTERLLREIPSRFNVSPVSVQLYMRTPRFEIRNGSISLASPTSVSLRNLDDVVHGHDESGAPFWTFLVEDRYFHGFSVVGVPPEFAVALGCQPDSGLDIQIENLPECRALSLHWRLSSLTGASLGYVGEPLRRLGLTKGDRARVTIATNRSARLSADDGNKPARPSQEADESLARMLNRRRAI